MIWLRTAVAAYALTDMLIGVQGYLAIHKMPWLVWNVGFGLVVLTGLILAASRPRLGYVLCALVAALDLVFFGRKLFRDQILWPNGIAEVMALAGLTCAVCLLAARPRDQRHNRVTRSSRLLPESSRSIENLFERHVVAAPLEDGRSGSCYWGSRHDRHKRCVRGH